jgi:glutathione S-transferase
MAVNPNASIEVTAFSWVPESAHGLVKDLRVRWALEEAGLDYRLRLIGAVRPAGYSQEQPFEQVPCLRDSAVQLFESGAIVQYIGESSEVLLPRDTQGRLRAIQWTYAALNSVEPAVQHRTSLDSFHAAEEWATLAKPTADEFARLRLRQVENWLSDKEWLEGSRFTIGDLIMITVLRLADRGRLIDAGTNLEAYLRRGEARPAFQRALADQLAAFQQHQPRGEAA